MIWCSPNLNDTSCFFFQGFFFFSTACNKNEKNKKKKKKKKTARGIRLGFLVKHRSEDNDWQKSLPSSKLFFINRV